MNSAISSVVTLLKPRQTQTAKEVNTVLYSTSLISELLFNSSLCMKDKGFEKIFLPNRDVILFPLSTNLNITCLIKHISSDILDT